MTKTNINLIVNGAKAYTRKTTGKPYTHALVGRWDNGKFSITNCSTKGPEPLTNPEMRHMSGYARKPRTNETFRVVEWFVLPIIDNTVTLAA